MWPLSLHTKTKSQESDGRHNFGKLNCIEILVLLWDLSKMKGWRRWKLDNFGELCMFVTKTYWHSYFQLKTCRHVAEFMTLGQIFLDAAPQRQLLSFSSFVLLGGSADCNSHPQTVQNWNPTWPTTALKPASWCDGRSGPFPREKLDTLNWDLIQHLPKTTWSKP